MDTSTQLDQSEAGLAGCSQRKIFLVFQNVSTFEYSTQSAGGKVIEMEVTAGANYDAPVLGEGVHNADVILALLTQNKELEGIFFCWFCERKNG